MTTIETLNQVFCTVFDDELIEISPEMTANDIDGWDSLTHINLVIAVENRFDIVFSQEEILGFKNVGDLLRGIESNL